MIEQSTARGVTVQQQLLIFQSYNRPHDSVFARAARPPTTVNQTNERARRKRHLSAYIACAYCRDGAHRRIPSGGLHRHSVSARVPCNRSIKLRTCYSPHLVRHKFVPFCYCLQIIFFLTLSHSFSTRSLPSHALLCCTLRRRRLPVDDVHQRVVRVGDARRFGHGRGDLRVVMRAASGARRHGGYGHRAR